MKYLKITLKKNEFIKQRNRIKSQAKYASIKKLIEAGKLTRDAAREALKHNRFHRAEIRAQMKGTSAEHEIE